MKEQFRSSDCKETQLLSELWRVREGAGNKYPKLSFLCPLILHKLMAARGQGSPDDEFCRDQLLVCFPAP